MKITLDIIIFKFGKKFRAFVRTISILYFRSRAPGYRRAVVRGNGKSIVDRKIKKTIKEYSKKRFGSSAYWPYLALYTEIRGQFIEGWIPYDYYRFIVLPEFNQEQHRHLSDMKAFDHRLFGDFAVTPLLLFILGTFYNDKYEVVDTDQVREFLLKYDDMIVVKEECGLEGKQVYIMHSSEFVPEKLHKSINYIFQPYIKQYACLNDLYPDSVNTFRVTTYLNKNGFVEIKLVVLRFGIDGLKVDNFSSGGQLISFDLTGKPSQFAYDLGFQRFEKHKNTGFVFSDLSIPMFGKMLELCKNAHKRYPYVRLVGWDVCIDDAGSPKLIEWNAANPGHWFFEAMYGPFWPTNDHF